MIVERGVCGSLLEESNTSAFGGLQFEGQRWSRCELRDEDIGTYFSRDGEIVRLGIDEQDARKCVSSEDKPRGVIKYHVLAMRTAPRWRRRSSISNYWSFSRVIQCNCMIFVHTVRYTWSSEYSPPEP